MCGTLPNLVEHSKFVNTSLELQFLREGIQFRKVLKAVVQNHQIF